jgi:hypothetical protein
MDGPGDYPSCETSCRPTVAPNPTRKPAPGRKKRFLKTKRKEINHLLR